MVEITGSYLGDLSVLARHGPTGSTLTTDAPTDNNGLGRAFSPTDLVATALGTCIVTVMGIVAARHGIDLVGTTWRVTKEMVADPKRRIGRLAVTLNLPAAIPAEARQILERAAHACPVHQSLSERVEAPIEFVYA